MGLRAGMDGCGKSRPHGDMTPGPSCPKGGAIPTKLSLPTDYKYIEYYYMLYNKLLKVK